MQESDLKGTTAFFIGEESTRPCRKKMTTIENEQRLVTGGSRVRFPVVTRDELTQCLSRLGKDRSV